MAEKDLVKRRKRAFQVTVMKLSVFAVAMLLVMVGLFSVFSNYQGRGTDTYSAVFTSASALKTGSRVQIAGVDVGSVQKVQLTRDNRARVTFTVNQDYRLPESVRVLIRYWNLTGDRYLELHPGMGPRDVFRSPGSEIPVSQTEPALDLDQLLGGFEPLFKSMNAADVNELTASLIAVFQGQGPALTQLLASTATLTDSLADRDQLIGDVIENLNTTLGTLDADREGVDQSIDRMQQLVSGLSGDREIIGESITQTSEATNSLAGLLSVTRPDLKESIAGLGETAQELLGGEDFLRSLLSRLPGDFKTLSNLGSYGAWLQIYFCRIRLLLPGPGDTQFYFTAIDAMGDKTTAGGRCFQE